MGSGGSLGIGSEDDLQTPGPAVKLRARATAISTTSTHACALLETSEIQCWGFNLYGQAGPLGGPRNLLEPGPPIVQNARAVSAGNNQTCALLENGSVRCWGITTDFSSLTPRDYPYSSDPIALGGSAGAIAAGEDYACALLETGVVKCWGEDLLSGTGQFLPMGFSPTPSAIPLKSPAVSVATGEHHACAMLDTGELECWGYVEFGGLGIGAPFGDDGIVIGLAGKSIAVSAGGDTTCALIEGGKAQCWGQNNFGQLGIGSTMNLQTPAALVDLGGLAVSMTTGTQHVCAILETGELKCWGANFGGELGLGDTTPRGGTPETVPAKLPAIVFE
jgi:alpha-tubulin suppressor-like RCC1 family protein